MTSRLTRRGYEKLIQEDREWLMKQPRTLERDHVAMILDKAVEYEYGNPAPTRLTVIDHTTNGAGVVLERRNVDLECSWQDDGRTLKIFLTDAKEPRPAEPERETTRND